MFSNLLTSLFLIPPESTGAFFFQPVRPSAKASAETEDSRLNC